MSGNLSGFVGKSGGENGLDKHTTVAVGLVLTRFIARGAGVGDVVFGDGLFVGVAGIH